MTRLFLKRWKYLDTCNRSKVRKRSRKEQQIDQPNELSGRKRRHDDILHQNGTLQMIRMVERARSTSRKVERSHDGGIGEEKSFSKSRVERGEREGRFTVD